MASPFSTTKAFFKVGNNEDHARNDVLSWRSDERVKSYDRELYQRLEKLFRERSLSSGQIKELFRISPSPTMDQKSIIHQVTPPLEKSMLSEYFSSVEIEKLSLLWIAVLAGYQDSAELLMRSGVDVDERFGHHNPQLVDQKWTILHMLLQRNPSLENERLVRSIIDHGADLQARDSRGQTALHYAVTTGQVRMIEMLIEKGADVNVADGKGMTPLLVAAENSSADKLLPLLVRLGADVTARDKDGRNVLHLIPGNHRMRHAVDLARILIEKGASLDDRCHKSHTIKFWQPLHLAVDEQKHELVKLYLDHGPDVNARLPSTMGIALQIAARQKEPEMLKILLDRGADIDQKAELNGRTALHAACFSRRENNISFLLSAGADVLIQDRHGSTALDILIATLHAYRRRGADNGVDRPSTRLIIKQLALKKVCQPTIELKDESIIKRYPELWDFYQSCIKQLKRAKSTRFIQGCTFFELLTKCRCRIATLMRNPQFHVNFKNYHISWEFSYYVEDMIQAFERAQSYYRSQLEQEKAISEAVYLALPYVVVRRVVDYIFRCCENSK